jgi:preprotein translocase subunit SecD
LTARRRSRWSISRLDAKGARIIKDVSRENVGKRMAILLFEKGKGEVVTAPVIRSEAGQPDPDLGRMTTAEANDNALLLRAGSLAAPMDIIEERTIGPSLGAENISKGFNSVIFGFAAIALFMCVYYQLFGVISTSHSASTCCCSLRCCRCCRRPSPCLASRRSR